MVSAIELLARVAEPAAMWRESHKGAPRFIELADGHYTRQKPGTNQAARPGVNLTLLLSDGTAAWNVWRPIPEVGRKDGLEAWECTHFIARRCARLASELVLEATAITFRRWGWPPKDGLISAIGVEETAARRSKRHPPGWCFRVAAWTEFTHPFPEPNQVWLRAPHPVRVPLKAP